MVIVAVAVLAGAAFGTTAVAATTVIHAGHLIAEPGKPVMRNQSIVVEAGKITAVKAGFVAGDTVIDLKGAWVMPGLIDMHAHVTGQLDLAQPLEPQLAHAFMGKVTERVFITLPRLKTLLMSGFTTVRNMGDPSSTLYDIRKAVNAGIVPGPRIFGTEAQISVDGGDYDAARWNVRPEYESDVENRGNCTGVVECTKVIRQEVQRGADVIKLRQAGLAVLDPKVAMVENEDEIKAIVATARQLNRPLAAHVTGTPAYLHMIIAAGADTIEHGPLDDKAIELMQKRGTAYTPTLTAGKMIQHRFEDGMRFLAKAYKAGVTILFGTDTGILPVEHINEEFALMAEAGMPPDQVLRAATVNAANALRRGDSLGSIAPGKMADIIAMKLDPLTHIGEVGKAESVTFVMKEGEVFKKN